MSVIFKYQIYSGETTIEMRAGAEIISVKGQHESICIWAIVDRNAATVCRRFDAVCTGGQVPEGKSKFLDTVLLHNESFVLHVFEVFDE